MFSQRMRCLISPSRSIFFTDGSFIIQKMGFKATSLRAMKVRQGFVPNYKCGHRPELDGFKGTTMEELVEFMFKKGQEAIDRGEVEYESVGHSLNWGEKSYQQLLDEKLLEEPNENSLSELY